MDEPQAQKPDAATEVPESEKFEPPPPPVDDSLKLTELQVARMEAFDWKEKAHVLSFREAQELLERRLREMNEVTEEYKKFAVECGINPKKGFEWDKDGNVTYHPDPQQKPRVPLGKSN